MKLAIKHLKNEIFNLKFIQKDNDRLEIITSLEKLLIESKKIEALKYQKEEDRIIEIICNYFRLTISELNTKSCEHIFVYPRQIAHYFIKNRTKLSLMDIGFKVGKKDHATVLHSIETINNYIDTNKIKRDEITEIETLINNYEN